MEIRFFNPIFTEASNFAFGSRTSSVRNGVYFASLSAVLADNSGYSVQSFGNSAYDINAILTINVTDAEFKLTREATSFVFTYTNPRPGITSEYPVYLFGLNDGGSVINIMPNMCLYYWKYWRNGELAQHLVPALDDYGVPCAKDLVTGNYLYNQGTGTFEYE